MMNRNYLNTLLIFIVLMASCKPKQSTVQTAVPSLNSEFEQNGRDLDSIFDSLMRTSNCIETISALESPDKKGPVTIHLTIDSLYLSDTAFETKLDTTFKLDLQSGVIKINEMVSVKIFHSIAQEYNVTYHLISYDVFIMNDECLERKLKSAYRALYKNSEQLGFSSGYPNQEGYIKVVWNLKRDN